MPSKSAYLIFFISTSLVIILVQVFVYFQFRRILRRDFPEWSKRKLPIIKLFFIAMNLPLLFLSLRTSLKFDTSILTTILLYPFTLWQFLMILWAIDRKST